MGINEETTQGHMKGNVKWIYEREGWGVACIFFSFVLSLCMREAGPALKIPLLLLFLFPSCQHFAFAPSDGKASSAPEEIERGHCGLLLSHCICIVALCCI